MRADLHTMEQIDLYLQGKLAGEELRHFENTLAANPELQTMVQNQQLLIQTVNRKALLAEIHVVAGIGGTPWYANPFVAIAGVAIAVGGIATAIYLMSDVAVNEEVITANEQILQPDSPELNENNTNADHTFYVNADSVSVAENPSEHYTTHHTHSTADGDEPDYFEAHTPNLNNQADQLSQHADDYSDYVADHDYETAEHISRTRMAAFPKGELALKDFVAENMRFPGTAKEKRISGNVKVKFLVTPEGTRTNVEANCFNLRDEYDKPLTSTQIMLNQKIANLFEREAARIVRIMPTWTPATDSQGNPVLAPVELYFNFSLKDGNSVYSLD